jgi:solute carrier family 25 carnitine/acylcarnitine transporter 20/29
MGAPLVGVTPIFALSFWSYDLGKKLATSFLPPATPTATATGEISKELTLPQLAFAGFFSAIPTTLVTGPAERVKVLLQVRRSRPLMRVTCRSLERELTSPTNHLGRQVSGQGHGAQYSGPVDVVRKLYAEGGLKSVFRGTGATLARDGPGSAASVLAQRLSKLPSSLTRADATESPATLSLTRSLKSR